MYWVVAAMTKVTPIVRHKKVLKHKKKFKRYQSDNFMRVGVSSRGCLAHRCCCSRNVALYC